MGDYLRDGVIRLIGREREDLIYRRTAKANTWAEYLYLVRQVAAGSDIVGDMFEQSLSDQGRPWGELHKTQTQTSLAEEDKLGGESESLIKCRRCGYNAHFDQAQTRAGDEAMTVFIECLNPACKIKYRL